MFAGRVGFRPFSTDVVVRKAPAGSKHALQLLVASGAHPFKASKPAVANPISKWTPQSLRTGVVGQKMGMMQLWDGYGRRFAVTVLKAENHVLHVDHTMSSKGMIQMELGAGQAKLKNVTKARLVHFRKAGIEPKARSAYFSITPDAVLPVGSLVPARHFVPGQFLDVVGITTGKGFAGGMKRWGFKGQGASHGVSLTHRSIGSTGQRQSPGRVFKGKKMPGHLGCDQRTVQNLQIYKIDPTRNLLFVKGSIPGFQGNWVKVYDAIKRPFSLESPPPFPTYVPSENDTAEDLVMELAGPDPAEANS